MEIKIGDWFTIKRPQTLMLDKTYRFMKVHMRERGQWAMKCFTNSKVDWMTYKEENLLYSIEKEIIVPSSPSEILEATVLESKLK